MGLPPPSARRAVGCTAIPPWETLPHGSTSLPQRSVPRGRHLCRVPPEAHAGAGRSRPQYELIISSTRGSVGLKGSLHRMVRW